MSLSQRANSIGSWLSLHSRRLLWPVWMVLIACWPHPALLIPLPWLFTLSSPVSLLRVVGFGGVFGVWYGLWSADWIRTCYCDSAWE
ncbi:MAG: hypothetical protein NT069_30020, partial [Planctomycetota bacterium]|nr:hypothetical protein [Planctomycetota bacterium]